MCTKDVDPVSGTYEEVDAPPSTLVPMLATSSFQLCDDGEPYSCNMNG